MTNTLVERDGYLFVLSENRDRYDPILDRWWYPTGIRATSYNREFVGASLEHDRGGVYQMVSDPEGNRYDYFRRPHPVALEYLGKTTPTFVEKIDIPPPKVRKGTKLRWNRGHWEKYLKTKGWVWAG